MGSGGVMDLGLLVHVIHSVLLWGSPSYAVMPAKAGIQ